ncbi:hypothetical protein PsYK624_023550 [Phanerochaete sordida]|uniref:Uncharacterized protein n=1 Tax=Phanerochaete sordida TaxID=48140 RepID=A0A9P3L8N2_9APHY|nr:hypothetical protein PsYK624_023550 [Phanerochaete sordida]
MGATTAAPEEAALRVVLAPTVPIALVTGVVPRAVEGASAAVEEVEVRMEAMDLDLGPLPTIKVPLKATWEDTLASSQGPRKTPTIRMALTTWECLSSSSSSSRHNKGDRQMVRASIIKDTGVMKTALEITVMVTVMVIMAVGIIMASDEEESVEEEEAVVVVVAAEASAVPRGTTKSTTPLLKSESSGSDHVARCSFAISSTRRIAMMYVACSRSMARYGLSLISLRTVEWCS